MAEDQELVCTTIFVDIVEYILSGQRRRRMVARHKCIARVSQQLGCEPDAVNQHVAVALVSAQWPEECRKTMEFLVMTCASTLWSPIDTVLFGNYRCSLERLRGKPIDRPAVRRSMALWEKSDAFYDGLSPKIRKLVRLLHRYGFETTDSGDGTNAAEGMSCAVQYPMVAISVTRGRPLKEVTRAVWLTLSEEGVPMGEPDAHGNIRDVQCTYSEADEIALVLVVHVTDDDLCEDSSVAG